MSELLYILEEISLPIILLIAAGYLFQKIFKNEIGALTKLVLYLFVPIMVFTKIYESNIAWDMLFQLILYMLLLQAFLYLVAIITSLIMKYNKSTRNAVANAMVMMNIGNYGIPLIDLVFPKDIIAMTSQIFIVVLQNITTSTFGVFQVSSAKSASRKEILKNMLRMPTIYVVILVAIIKAAGITLPDMIKVPCDYISNAFVAVALIVLGMQLADVKLSNRLKDVVIVSVIKVLATSLAAFAIVLLLGIKGVLAPALIIGVSTPTAVNTAILAREFGSEADFAAQIVLLTTFICTFTLPFVIFFVKAYYGLG